MAQSANNGAKERSGKDLNGRPAALRGQANLGSPGKEAPGNGRKTAPFRMSLSASREELLDEGGKTDDRFRQLLYDFSTLGSSLEVARAYLAAQIGISPPQYNIAMVLASHQNTGGIRVSDVAKHLHVSTAFITLEAGSLEQAGLVEKRPNPEDGRGVFLRLTGRGERLVQSIGPERRKVNDQLFGSLSAKDFRRLCDILSSLLDDFAYTVRLLKSARGDKASGPSLKGVLDSAR
jgi:DNA-binding MarR family transcriptional regulator